MINSKYVFVAYIVLFKPIDNNIIHINSVSYFHHLYYIKSSKKNYII